MKILIENVDLLSMDGNENIEKNINIYIEEDRIVHIGAKKEDFKADKIIDGRNKLAMPGLINAHTHLAMSLLRNFADDLPLHEWLEDKIWPIEAKLNEEDIYWGTLLSLVEMIKTGTTNFCDMYFSMDQVGKAVDESGIRGTLTIGMTAMDMEKGKMKLEETEKFYTDWHNKKDGRIRVMLGPHSPYTCSTEFLEESVKLAKKLNTGIHIHLSETEKELKDSLEEFSLSPIKRMEKLGLFDVHTVAAHCVHIDDEDIELIRKNNVFPVYNPVSNLKLASGFAPVSKMIKKGIPVALGTDGSSSNNNLNLFEEMKLAGILNKAVDKDASSVSAYEVLEMATINGARALGLEEEIGSIEVGKKADLILLDIDKPYMYPRHNLISAVVYSANGFDVDTSIVNGNIIMENRRIKTLDEEKIMFKVEEIGKDLVAR